MSGVRVILLRTSLLFLRFYFNLPQPRKVKQYLQQFLYNVPLSQMNRLIISNRQAYVEFPIQSSAGPKAH